MDKLDELIYQTRQMATMFEKMAAVGTNVQEVMGKQRPCCIICGNCPDALLQELEAVRETLLNDLKARKAGDSDVQSE